jgi:7-carboxy-7-deazaguanine synthase
MKVCEIFKSIQGESSHAGWPSVFVRFTGCNLRCVYCDTRYAYEEGFEISESDLFGRVESFELRAVTITGGEPLLQKEVIPFSDILISQGYTVLLETNGTQDISRLDRRIIKILDIKCPDSGSSESTRWENLGLLEKKDEVKFVISSRDDFEWTKRVITQHSLPERTTINLSPAFGYLEPQHLAEWILEDNLAVRLNLQLHKYIWKNRKRGV